MANGKPPRRFKPWKPPSISKAERAIIRISSNRYLASRGVRDEDELGDKPEKYARREDNADSTISDQPETGEPKAGEARELRGLV